MDKDRFGRPSAYLGDGAYASFTPELGEIVVYTSDGLHKTNRVVLGPREFSELLRFFCDLRLESKYLVKQ